MSPALMTKREAALRVRVHPETFNRLCREGRGPALTYVGGKAVVREDRLVEWIDAGTRSVSAPVATPVQAAE